MREAASSERKRTSFFRKFGPGLITGASNNDPSSIATFSQSGAQFGYSQLWIVLFLYPLLTAVQELSGRIGTVTGKGISAIIREQYGNRVLLPAVVLVAVANIINLGADIGAMAESVDLLLPLSKHVLVVFFGALILAAEIFVPYRSYAKVLKFLALSLLCYPLTLILTKESWLDLLKATFIPTIEHSPDFVFMVMAAIGTTISPYMFIWQASQEVEDQIDKGQLIGDGDEPIISHAEVRDVRTDTSVGMLVSQFTFWSIVAVAAGVLHRNGVTTIDTASDAAKALQPLVSSFPYSGTIAEAIFAVGIVGLGLLAVPILSASSSYALSDAIQCKAGLYLTFTHAKCFYIAITAATAIGLFINFTGINPMRALILSSVINGICAVPLLFLIFLIGRNKRVMKQFRSRWLSNTVVLTALLGMGLAVVAMILNR